MILAIGGGSSMDTAKGIGIIVENPEFEDVVSVDVSDIPDVAIADPDMMASMSAGLTAATGMDALCPRHRRLYH